MNYEEALEFIHNTYKFGEKIGLENITALLKELGDPQKGLKYVHVAGTNGKGSTCAMLSNVLVNAGYKTGLYISPYLEEFTERMQINNTPIDKKLLAELTEEVKAAIDRMLEKGLAHPSEFEVVTAIGFLFFAREKADIVILEVGMGGRMDATNVIETNEAAVIVSLSYDHQQYLGNTLEEIAFEKAGIIKENDDVMVYALNPESTVEVIKKQAEKKNARVHVCNKDYIKKVSADIDSQTVEYLNPDSVLGVKTLKLALLGEHQLYNALNALYALEILKKKGWEITPEAIETGFAGVKFTGRFEILHKDPVILIDGGHNIDGITAFTNNIKQYFKGEKVVLFYGMLKDKQVDDSIKLLTSIAKKMYTLTPQEEGRAIPAKQMAEIIKRDYPEMEVTSLESFKEIDDHIDLSQKDEVYAFTGSLYMIGEARTEINRFLAEKGQN